MSDVKTTVLRLANDLETPYRGAVRTSEICQVLREAAQEIERLEPLAALAVSQTADQLRAAFSPDLKAIKLWLANPGSNEEWNADDVDMCRRALVEIERLERDLAAATVPHKDQQLPSTPCPECGQRWRFHAPNCSRRFGAQGLGGTST